MHEQSWAYQYINFKDEKCCCNIIKKWINDIAINNKIASLAKSQKR